MERNGDAHCTKCQVVLRVDQKLLTLLTVQVQFLGCPVSILVFITIQLRHKYLIFAKLPKGI
jgi:hypothetical protein